MPFAKPVRFRNFDWKDNLSRGSGQRLYYSLPPPSSATLLRFSLLLRRSKATAQRCHSQTFVRISYFLDTTGRANPPRNHAPLTNNSKKPQKPKPSKHLMIIFGPIAMKKIKSSADSSSRDSSCR